MNPYRTAIEERIAELLRYRSWYRLTPWAATWSDLRRDNDTELRALLRIARKARRAERAEGRDPITQAKGMTEGERVFAWGR